MAVQGEILEAAVADQQPVVQGAAAVREIPRLLSEAH